MIKHYDHTHPADYDLRSCTLVTPKAYRTHTADGQRVRKPKSLRRTWELRTGQTP